ncbi:hypothetical protein C8A03DRAFT_36047 [Achaetomium macrosporum]|uniref:DUF7025 domain-containing protein n=1 Tax=Achaetomium macrosporum TaxID=79813 RepID=A0AAN7C6D9_9PEZI|nr:hypothetical protein C8A03DRAFT_36047 [Achaetomium macrosporum]
MLATLDQRLQALEHSWKVLPAGSSSTTAAPIGNSNGLQLTPQIPEAVKHMHIGFATKQEVNPDGSTQLQQIIVEKGELLSLLLQISSPCLNRHQIEKDTIPGHKTSRLPFIELFSYRNILRFVEWTGRLDNGLRALYFSQTFTTQLSQDIAELLNYLDAHCEESAHIWGVNAARGLVLFDDLPGIFSPGTLLIESGDAGQEQVIEVFSCHTVSASSTSEACVVEGWHFRWDGTAFSRTSIRFSVNRYGGARPIDGLFYRPIIGSDPDETIELQQQLIVRNRTALNSLKGLSEVEVGDYPFCIWKSSSASGMDHRKPVSRPL